MNPDRLYSIGWRLVLGSEVAAVVLGLILLSTPLDPGAEPYMGMSLGELRRLSPRVADWVWHENKESIIGFVLVGVAGALIAWNALRKGDRWAWYTTLILGGGYGLTYIAIHASIQYTFYIPVAMILLAAILLGLVLTAPKIFTSSRG